MADNTKELIASSEFDPSNFVRGIDAMTAALEKLSEQEDSIKAELKNINTALATNRQEYKNTTTEISNLDKSSKTYKDDLQRLTAQKKLLIAQQKELKVSMEAQKTSLVSVNTAANSYRASVEKITLVTKQAVAAGKGASFFDTVNLSTQVAEIAAASGKLRDVFKGKISTAELDKFEQSLAQTNDEFAQLGQIVTFVKSKLDTLDPNSQEFEELNRVIQVGETVMEAYAQSTEHVDKKSVSLRTRLAALRTSLSDLESQGKENTKEFETMAIEAGRLQDQMEDTQQRIKVLGSDTKNLDFGIGAIRGVASAFGVAEGAAALFGLKNEDVIKSVQRLNAIMLILNGLQEIQTLLQKQSVVAVVGQEIATKAAAAAQRIYAVTIGTTTGALKAFRIALAASVIGAVIIAIGFLVSKYLELQAAAKKASREQKILTEITIKAADAFGDARLEVVSMTEKIKLAKQGFIDKEVVLKEYNETIGKTIGQTTSLDEAEQLLIKHGPDYIQLLFLKAKAQAAGALAAEAAKKSIEDDAKAASEFVGTFERIFSNDPAKQRAEAKKKALAEDEQTTKDYFKKMEDIQAEAAEFAKTHGLVFEPPPTETAKPGTAKSAKEIENVFTKTLRELIARLRDVSKTEIESVDFIQQQFTDKLFDEIDKIDDLVAKKQLTVKQGNILTKILEKIIGKESDKAVADFKKKVADAIDKLTEELADQQNKVNENSLNLLRDEFEKRAKLIEFNEAKELADAKKATADRLEVLDLQRLLIGEQAYQDAKAKIISTGEQNALNILEKFRQERQELAADTFQKLQEQTKTIFANVQLVVSETATAEVEAATEQFQQGKINYEQYQKELTRIATEETDRRIRTQLREAQALLKDVIKQIPTEKDPERLKELQDQERELRNRIADLKKELALAEGTATKKDTDERNKRIQELANYANAIGGIIQQVVGFWQQVNEAEQRSLERSIALQERRVEAATRIAERGNSEYLRLEEDRLQELQTKQENAARRQIAINAVLQTSQALTAFISALAQGIALGGPLGGLAIATAVIAAIASGYAIVASLQSKNTVTLKGGTKFLEGREHPDGVDTVPARLTKGEAVLPVDINRDYHPAVKAIFDRKIPAQEINNFVNNYRVNSRVLPTVNYEKMSEATQVMISYDGELLSATKEQTRKIEENTDLLGRVEYRLKTMGIEVNLDRNGLAVSLMKTVEQFKIDRKA